MRKNTKMPLWNLSNSGIFNNVDIYIDAAGAKTILETYQDMANVDFRMVIVAVLAGKRPVDLLAMTFGQYAIIGSGGIHQKTYPM